jgi:type I restriction enzyme S subunit
MKWEKVAIKDICTGIYDGPHATPPLSDTGAIFLGISNFNNGRLDFSDIRYISEDDLPKWTKRVIPQKNDIVFSYEATLNLYAIIPEGFRGCLGRRMALLRVDETKADYKFLYYYFYSDAWRATVNENIVLGATVDRIPLIKFPDFPVELPPLETQHRIADILSAYDDLIENNQKQIKLLEEAAQRLYKEWFVNLRFPGHENTKIVDGVPEGWRKFPLEEIAPVVTGKKDANYGDKGGNYPFFTCSQETITAPGYSFDTSAVILAGNGDFNVKLYRGKFEAYQRTYVLAPFDHSNLFNLYFTVQDNMEALAKGASGSTIKFLTKGMLQKILVLTADKKVLDKFNDYEENIQQKVEALKKQVEDLTEIRNRLLPKLMSGEVEV